MIVDRRNGFAALAALAAACAGCGPYEGVIQIDQTAEPIRFIVHHDDWPRPFWYKRITEFAIASDQDGRIWELKSASPRGVGANQLALLYGRTPEAFTQSYPAGNERPGRLVRGRTYYVAAGGPRALYKMAFALPVTGWEVTTGRQPNKGRDEATTQPSAATGSQPIDPRREH